MADVIQIAFEAIDRGLENKIKAIDSDLSKLERQIEITDKSARNFGITSEQIAARMGQIGKAATIGVTLPLVGLGTAAVKAASDLNETTTKIETLFGNSSDAIQKFAATAATSLGQSKKQALDAAADFAIFGKAAGLAGNDLVDFSKKNVQLAADFASFFNTSPEEAITAIGAAFRGESEPIRRYGVLINEAALKDEALRMGLIKTTTEALQPQARVLAAQALIMKQTTAAQGDFARTSEGLANQSRILNAQFQDTIASLGQSLLPTVIKVAGAANDLLMAFNNLDQPQKDLIVGFGLMAAAAGPVLTIGGRLITTFGALSGIAVDVGAKMLTMGRSVVGVVDTFSRVGVTSYTVSDALIRLKASGALLAGELGIIVLGLVAVAKYLGEVDAASKATSEDLIAMSRSGDVFKQAAATTEILAHGQDRLKVALDGTHAKIKEGAKDYADYRSSIEATAKAAGYQIDAQGNLTQVINTGYGPIVKIIEANYAMSQAMYDAVPGTAKLGEAWRLLVDTGKQFADIVVPKNNAAIIPLARNYGVLTGAINKAQVAGSTVNNTLIDVSAKMADLHTVMAGAIGKEMTQYNDKQGDLTAKAKELQDEIAKLEAEQGRASKTTVQHAMSANELALAQEKLVGMQTRLANETDPAKQRELAAQIAVARDRLNEANTAVVSYVDNSKRIGELRGQYDDINAEIEANAKAHEEATRRILFGYAEQQLAIGGLTETEAKALDALAVQWGLKSKADIEALQRIRDASKNLVNESGIPLFVSTVTGMKPIDIPVEVKLNTDELKAKALPVVNWPVTPRIDPTTAKEKKLDPIEVPVKPRLEKTAKTTKDLETDLKSVKPSLVVTPMVDASKAKDTIGKFWDSPEVKRVQEPVNMPVKADTNAAITSLQYLGSYGLSPLVTYFDTLIQRAGLFNQIVAQIPGMPTIPTIPTVPTSPTAPTSPYTPTRPPGSGEQEFATGGAFTVPSGYPNDSYRIGVSSGEHVQVTPAGDGRMAAPVLNLTINAPSGEAGAIASQVEQAVYKALVDVYQAVM